MPQSTTTDTTIARDAVRAPAQPARAGIPLRWALAAALLPFLILGLLRASDGPGLEADDYGQYLMHAEALAQGRPYGDIGYIYSSHGSFIGPAAAAPGVPLVLAPVLAVLGRNAAAIKAVMFAFAVVLLLLAGRYFAVHDDRRLGLAVALLSGLSPAVVHASMQALSDLPFAATIWAVLLLYERPGPWRAGRMLAATLLIAWAILFRPIGIVLLPAAALYAALAYREHGLRPAVPALVLAVAGMLLGFAFREQLPILDIVRRGSTVWVHAHELAWGNILTYRLSLFGSHLYPFPWARANDAYHVLSTGLMVVGLAAWLRRSWRRFAALFAVLYVATLIALPFSQERYLWPLYPISVFGLVNGVRVAASRLLPARPATWATRPALAFALVLALLGAVQVAAQPRRGSLAEVPELQQVIAYLQRLARHEEVRVVFHKPRMLAWESGIPAMPAIRRLPDVTLAELRSKRISHIVLAARDDLVGPRNIRRAIEAAPQAFTLEYRNATYLIYRFHAGRVEGGAHTPPLTVR